MSVCARFLASSVKTVRAIRGQFSGSIDPLGGCVLLHFYGVQSARGTRRKAPPKIGFPAFAGRTLQRRIIELCEKTNTGGRGCTCFLWRQRRGVHRTPVSGIENISGDLHQEDSYHRMTRVSMQKLVC